MALPHSAAALQVVLLLILSGIGIAMPMSIVETLPGYSGNLPFKLETGYVGVGDMEELQLFYYFIESQRNPVRDPLLLWLTGGPGCSSFSGLAYEIGPLSFDVAAFNGSLPTLVSNPHSWTKIANIIFLDAPVGAGFSYSTSSEGYYTSDTKSSQSIFDFLKKWLMDHQQFSQNPLYITGNSYSGMIIPMVVQKISKAQEAGDKLFTNLQGYLIGNPVTFQVADLNSRVAYAHRVGLLSNDLYESLKTSCNGTYVTDQDNAQCVDDLQLYFKCIERVNEAQILEPKCSFGTPNAIQFKWDQSFIENIPLEILQQSPQRRELWCRNFNYVLSFKWANDPSVQEALNIRNGTITDWKWCNKTIAYDYDVDSVVDYHRNLTHKPYRALIYSGDHDMIIPYLGTLTWISSLNLTTVDSWRPWFVDGQVAGFTEKYESNHTYRLTYATVKGGGHTAPEYKPKQCLEMADRWFSYYIL